MGKFGPKNLNCQFKLKFVTKTNSNMPNSMGCSLFMSQTGNTLFEQIWFNKSKFFSLSRNLGPIYEFTEFNGGEIWDEYTEFNGGVHFFYFIPETPFVTVSATMQE